MEETEGRCFKIGALVALAEAGLPVEEGGHTHLQVCANCSDLNQALRAVFSKSLLKEGIPAPSGCPHSDIDLLARFLVFLQTKTSKDDAAGFFRHFNDCYPCSEWFAENWNAYLSTKQNIGAS